MQWRDQAIVLGARRFGESGLILDVLTSSRGRQSGLVYGGASRRKRPQLEPGNTLEVAWTGRLEEQLGRFETAEASSIRAAHHLDQPEALLGITAVTTILRGALDEGDHAASMLFEPTEILLDALQDWSSWPALYARWELGLLSSLGFGLDLETCAVSGANDGLSHVSPATGRAVRGSEAEDYLDRLFALPAFLLDSAAPYPQRDIEDALSLTGFFLERRLFGAVNKAIPPPRTRLVAKLTGQTG